MLKRPIATLARRVAGVAAVLTFAIIAGVVANATQEVHAQEVQAAKDSPMRVLFKPSIGSFYPRAAVTLGLAGSVTVLAEYDATGVITSAVIQTSDPPGVFEEAALSYIREIRVSPAMKDGLPVAGKFQQKVLFRPDPVQK